MDNLIVDIFFLLLGLSGLYTVLGISAGIADKLAKARYIRSRNMKREVGHG